MDSDAAVTPTADLLEQLRNLINDRHETAFEAVTREQLAELKADVRAIQERLGEIPDLTELRQEVRDLKRQLTGLLWTVVGAIPLTIVVDLFLKNALGLR